MAYDTITVPISQLINIGSAFAVAYPSGRNKESYNPTAHHTISSPRASSVYTAPVHFTAGLGDAHITITLISMPSLPPQLLTLTMILAEAAPDTAPGAGSGVQQMTDEELQNGTGTAPRTISPAQLQEKVDSVAGVTSVAGRDGAVSLAVDDVSGAVSSGITIDAGDGSLTLTGPSDLSDNKTFAVTFAGNTGDYGTAVTPARSDHNHPVATTSVRGMMSATDKTKLDGLSAGPTTVLAYLNSGNMQTTFTDMVATTLRTATGTWQPVDCTGLTHIYFEWTQTVGGTSSSRIYPIFSIGSAPSYTWYMADGTVGGATDGTLALTDGSAAPSEPNAYQGISMPTVSVTDVKQAVTLPTSFRTRINVGYIRCGGDGAADPAVAHLRVTCDGALTSAAASLPTTASTLEMQTGTETSVRSVSPALVKDAILALAPAAPSIAQNSFMVRKSSGSGAAEEGTPSEVKTILSLPADTATGLSYTTFNGIVDKTQQTLSYNAATRTFTVTRVGDYDVWAGGTKTTITATKTVVHANTSSTFYIYFDSSGTLIASTTKWTYGGNNAPVAVLTFSVNGAVGLWGDYRSTYRRSFHEWEYQELQIGPWIDGTGYGLSFGSTDGTVAVASGRHVVGGYGISSGSAITTVSLLRRRSDLTWNQNSAASADMRLAVGATLGYDSAGTQSPVNVDYYVNQWLILLNGTVHAVTGQRQHSTQTAAEAETIDQVQLPGSLAAIGRPLARVTYQRTTAVPLGIIISYDDLRYHRIVNGITLGGGGGGGGGGASAPPSNPIPDGYITFALDIFIQGKPAAGDVVYRKAMNQKCKLLGSTAGHACSARVAAATGGAFAINREIWGGTDYTTSAAGAATFSTGSGSKRGAITLAETTFEAADAVQITAPSTADSTLEDISISLLFALLFS